MRQFINFILQFALKISSRFALSIAKGWFNAYSTLYFTNSSSFNKISFQINLFKLKIKSSTIKYGSQGKFWYPISETNATNIY